MTTMISETKLVSDIHKTGLVINDLFKRKTLKTHQRHCLEDGLETVYHCSVETDHGGEGITEEEWKELLTDLIQSLKDSKVNSDKLRDCISVLTFDLIMLG